MKLYCGWFIFTTLVSLVVSDVHKENPDDGSGNGVYPKSAIKKHRGNMGTWFLNHGILRLRHNVGKTISYVLNRWYVSHSQSWVVCDCFNHITCNFRLLTLRLWKTKCYEVFFVVAMCNTEGVSPSHRWIESNRMCSKGTHPSNM